MNEKKYKVFISYSWTSQEHQNDVVDLANELIDNGIETIIDVYDLTSGDDKYKFMEKMVNDEKIQHVLMICNKSYAEKADTRDDSGVGEETQIISPHVYRKSKQSKFIPIIWERDDEGNTHTPAYLNSRIYIDLSSEEKKAEEFDKLIRHIFDKPRFTKPKLGTPPSYIFEDNNSKNTTGYLYHKVLNSIANNKPNRVGILKSFLNKFIEITKKINIKENSYNFSDEYTISRIKDYIPIRDEYLKILKTIAQYQDNSHTKDIHKFLEEILSLSKQRKLEIYQNDFFIYIARELFLYTIAAFLSEENFLYPLELLNKPYIYTINKEQNSDSFYAFKHVIDSLNEKNKRLEQQRTSIIADTLCEFNKEQEITYAELSQADFVIYLRSLLNEERSSYWFPFTLILGTSYHPDPYKLFIYSEQKQYFLKNICPILKINSITYIHKLIRELEEGKKQNCRIDGYHDLCIKKLINLSQLCTR